MRKTGNARNGYWRELLRTSVVQQLLLAGMQLQIPNCTPRILETTAAKIGPRPNPARDPHVSGLDKLLSERSVQDGISVLDEIDSRLEVIAAIEKLSGDSEVDEVPSSSETSLASLGERHPYERWRFMAA